MVFHNRPFKKDLTPFAKGGRVVKHIGKGAREGSSGALTGGDPFGRMANHYPKPSDLAPSGAGLGGPPTSQPTSPVPMGSRPPQSPTAMMPDSGGGGMEPDEDDAA
jgi:hypothetical protein